MKVSKKKCTQMLRALFGPKAYFQKAPDGLRVVAFAEGQPTVVAQATLKPDQTPTDEELARIPFALLQAAAQAAGFVVSVRQDGPMQYIEAKRREPRTERVP